MDGMTNSSVWLPEDNLKRFSYILDNIEDAFFHLDNEFRFSYVNQAAAWLAAMPRERLLGQVIWDVWPEVKNECLESLYRQAVETGKAQQFQHYGVRNDRHYEVTLYPSPDGPALLVSDKTEKIRSERQLREMQERFSLALQAARMITWEWDLCENRMDFSGAFDDFYGVQNTLCFTEMQRMVHRDDLRAHLKKIRQALRDGSSYESTFRVIRPDNGEVAWLEEWGMGVTGEDGRVRKLVGVVKNITERKQVDDALRASEERLQLASRAVPGVLYDWSLNREAVYQSEGLERMVGYRPLEDPARQKKWWPENIHVEDYPRVQAALRAAIESGTDSFSYEYRIRHKDGHWVNVCDQGYIVRDAQGQAQRVVGTCVDISDRVRAKDRFRASVETLLDGFAIFSAVREEDASGRPGKIIDFRYEYINETGCRMNRRTYEEQVGHTLLELLPAHREKGLFDRYVRLVETGEPLEIEDEEYEDYYGGERRLRRAFEVRGVKLDDGFALVWRNVSQRKQSEQQIRTYADKLERSNRELEQFAFVASHDLQEPLRKIHQFGDSLRKKFGTHMPAEAVDSLDRMQNAARRMQDMINGLLELSRVSTRGGSFENTDLREVVDEVLSDLDARLQVSKGRVECDDLPSAKADAMQMRQLFQNLIGNALKFHQPGVPPVVRISSKPAQYGSTPAITITVQDNGIGFEMEYAERIFQPYQRLHGRSQYEGTGMGLAICHKIVERHHGKIEVQSQPGAGTTFFVTLPLEQGK